MHALVDTLVLIIFVYRILLSLQKLALRKNILGFGKKLYLYNCMYGSFDMMLHLSEILIM